MKRRKQKELARKIIRYALNKYGVRCYNSISDDFGFEQCVFFKKILGRFSIIFLLFISFISCTTIKEIYVVVSEHKKEIIIPKTVKYNRFTKSFSKADSLFKISKEAARKTNEELMFYHKCQ